MGTVMPKIMWLPFHFGSGDVSMENRTYLNFRWRLQFVVVSPKQLLNVRICALLCVGDECESCEIKTANGSYE